MNGFQFEPTIAQYVGPTFVLSTDDNEAKDFHIVSTSDDGKGISIHSPKPCMIQGGSWNSDPSIFRARRDVPVYWVLYFDNRVFSSKYSDVGFRSTIQTREN
jgi:hypothetical protein